MTGGDGVRGSAQAAAPLFVRVADTAAAVSVVALGVAAWVGANGFPEAMVEGQVGADFWPKVVAALMAALGGALLLLSLAGRIAPVSADPANPTRWLPLAVVLVVLALYPLAWSLIGFVPATIATFAIVGKILGVGNWWRALAWAALLALVIWGLFGQLLQVPL